MRFSFPSRLSSDSATRFAQILASVRSPKRKGVSGDGRARYAAASKTRARESEDGF